MHKNEMSLRLKQEQISINGVKQIIVHYLCFLSKNSRHFDTFFIKQALISSVISLLQ